VAEPRQADRAAPPGRRLDRVAEVLLPFGLAVLVLGPALGPGFSLSYDMVFVPKLPFTARLLGIDGSVPRAVPSDAVVAMLSRVVPAELLQKVVLIAIVVAAASGAARLMRSHGRLAACAAAVLYVWNPYLGSRLLLGQWAILVALAVLPWLVLGTSQLGSAPWRGAGARGAARVLVLLAVASISPSGGLIAGATALTVVALRVPAVVRRVRWAAFVLVSVVVVNLPWILPAMLRQGGLPADPLAADAFAARADTSLGTIFSVLTLGGTWNAQTTPTGREGALAAGLLLLLLALALVGIGLLRGDRRSPWFRGLAAAGAAALLVALAGSLPGLEQVLRWVITEVPGGALLRDGTRYLPPWVLLASLGFGRAVQEAHGRIRSPQLSVVAAGLGLVLPVAVLAGLVWGGVGQLGTVRYPAAWAAAREAVGSADDGSMVLLLPWGSYRQFPWNDLRTMYDPANRWVPARTVADDRLLVGDHLIAGEDPIAARLTPLVESPAPLAPGLVAQGVGWVLLERTTPGGDQISAARFAGMTLVVDSVDLQLWRVAGSPTPGSLIRGARFVTAVDLGVLGLFVGALLVAAFGVRSPMSRTREATER